MHTVKFEKNRFNGLWRARCTCGWFEVGAADLVQSRAATHDLDPEWQPVEPTVIPLRAKVPA